MQTRNGGSVQDVNVEDDDDDDGCYYTRLWAEWLRWPKVHVVFILDEDEDEDEEEEEEEEEEHETMRITTNLKLSKSKDS